MAYVIKRYSNRKLYDTQESRYVTLEELEELIRAGKEIAVVDVSTGEDLTSVTLAQIILENERAHRATLPTAFLSGAAAAAGIAVINSIGNLAGFAGPFAMGWIRDHTGSYAGGLLLLAALGIVAMGIVLLLGHDDALERGPPQPPQPAQLRVRGHELRGEPGPVRP